MFIYDRVDQIGHKTRCLEPLGPETLHPKISDPFEDRLASKDKIDSKEPRVLFQNEPFL
jgi:hypothetical protein